MNVTVNLVYVIGLMLYSLTVTGFWLCALIGSSKDRQDELLVRELARADKAGSHSERDQSQQDMERAICDLHNAQESIKHLEQEKQKLASAYIKTMNEYAWYRTLVRAHNSEAHYAALAEMKCRRKSVVGCGHDEESEGCARESGAGESVPLGSLDSRLRGNDGHIDGGHISGRHTGEPLRAGESEAREVRHGRGN